MVMIKDFITFTIFFLIAKVTFWAKMNHITFWRIVEWAFVISVVIAIIDFLRWKPNNYRWNGEGWYIDKRSIWKRCRQWVIWVGGWEKANAKGWEIFRRGESLILKGNKVQRFLKRFKPRSITPVSLFGHRITFYGWGVRALTPWGHMTYTFKNYAGLGYPRWYISSDGTPSRAHVWILGTPADVREAQKEYGKTRGR